jgi:hypothetical protein
MAYSFNGSSQAVTVQAPVVTTLPFTLSCWFRVSQAQSTSVRILINITHSNDASGTGRGTYRLVIPANSTLLRAIQILTGVNTGTADTASNTIVANTWLNAVAVFTSTTSRTLYLTGANSVTNTTSVTAPSVNNFAIASLLLLSPSTFSAIEMAEVGVWTAALNTSEITSLSAGISPSLIRPQSLQLYAPLVRDLIDLRGQALTNVGDPSISSHPRIYL